MNENTHATMVEAPPPPVISADPHVDESEETHFQIHQFVDALYEPSDILEFRILPSRQSRWTQASALDEVLP